MGCCGPIQSTKKNTTSAPIPRRAQPLPSLDKDIFKLFNVLWINQHANLPANKGFRDLLTAQFHQAEFVDSPEDADRVLVSSPGPLVLVSSSDFAGRVTAIAAKYRHVTTTYTIPDSNDTTQLSPATQIEVTPELQKAAMDQYRFLRYFDSSWARSFYSIDGDESFINALSAAAQKGKFSVFFPLGVKAVKLEECLSPENVDKICEHAMEELPDPREQSAIKEAARALKLDCSLEGILRSYSMNGLYRAVNIGLRKGSGYDTFLNYVFCLKGAMCEKGETLQRLGTDCVYRYLRLDPQGLLRYQERQGSIVFMAGFTSASSDQLRVKRYTAWNEGCKENVVMKIQLVEPSEEYNEVIERLGFPEENGVFFPVNIAKISMTPEEAEVVFPPFYPFRVTKVDTSSVPNVIWAQTPYCVNVAGLDWISVVRKSYSREENWNKAYLDTVLALAKNRVITKLSIGTISVL